MANIPNPSGAIIYFMIITLFFIIGIVYNILQTKTIHDASFSIDNNINNSIYLLFLVLGSYFINIVTLKAMCYGMEFQWGYITLITLLPWIIIFVSLYFILKIFPGWASPFSNTIGYSVIGLLGVEKIYESIFKTSEDANGNSELDKAIANINSNRGKFVNQISTNEIHFNEFFNNMGEAIKTDKENMETHKLKLYQLLVIKQFIGKIVWYILAGILICSISYNLIISTTCEKSLAQIEKDFETIRAE